MQPEQVDELLISGRKDLSQGCGERETGEHLHQVVMCTAHAKWKATKVMNVLARMVVIQSTLSCHSLARAADSAGRSERHENVESAESWDDAVFWDIRRAWDNADDSFDEGLEHTVGG